MTDLYPLTIGQLHVWDAVEYVYDFFRGGPVRLPVPNFREGARAERAVVRLAGSQEVAPEILVYLNRLSDLLFDLARLANHRAGSPETRWNPRE